MPTRKDLEVSSETSLVTYKMSSTRRARPWVTPGDSQDLTLSSDARDGAWHPFGTKMTFVFQSEYSAKPLDNKNLAASMSKNMVRAK